MARKLTILALSLFMTGSASINASAEESPKLRTIERHQVQSDQKKAPKTPQNNGSDSAKIAAIPPQDNGAKKAALSGLPVSNIELPKGFVASKTAKKDLAQAVSSAMSAKALKNTLIGMQVVDLDTGDIVYAKNADMALKPASNTKLVTTACALGIFGPDHQFETAITARGKVEKGIVNGDLQLHIDHDFTWSNRFYSTGDVPMIGLLSQLKAAGIRKVTGNVIVSGYVVYGGIATGTLSTAVHLRKAANQFAALLKKQGIAHGGLKIQQAEKRQGKVLASWLSPMLSEAIVPLNRASHNEYADMLLLAIGDYKNGKNTYEAGAKAEIAYLQSIGMNTDGLKLYDGSGLSHDNRVKPSFFTSLVNYMLKESGYAREYAASMSISGFDGTYGGRLAMDDGKGRVYAKSGTLKDVISGSGFFVNRHDGHTYAFSIMVNGNRNRKLTRQAIDRMLRPFLADFQHHPIPAAPRFSSFRRENDGRVIARWDGVKNAAGYRIYGSQDGNIWKAVAETKDTALVMPNESAHLRVTAVSKDGAESLPSLIYSYRPGAKTLTIMEQAQCRSDEEMRPSNHTFAHERPLALFADKSFGVETIRDAQAVDAPKALLMHSTACGGKITIDGEYLEKTIKSGAPVIVNIVDTHLSTSEHSTCAPSQGKFLGCYGEPVVSKDRRIGERKRNYRLRKAAGSGSSRPSSVTAWKGGKPVLEMADTTVAVREKSASGSLISVIGVDLQALDSQKTLDAAWKLVGL